MDTNNLIQEFFQANLTSINPFELVFNLLLAALLAHLLAIFYTKYGASLSNRRDFGNNFIMVTMTTMLIITIIKSSLALSLGLIGALSIVRFRAAIKEPEELTFLFLAIAVGLGLGAQQRTVTILSMAVILLVLRVKKTKLVNRPSQWQQDMYINISTSFPDKLPLEKIQELLAPHCKMYRIKRVERSGSELDSFFLVEFSDNLSFEKVDTSLRQIESSVRISFIDQRGSLTGSL
jgi:hypothetical protein